MSDPQKETPIFVKASELSDKETTSIIPIYCVRPDGWANVKAALDLSLIHI